MLEGGRARFCVYYCLFVCLFARFLFVCLLSLDDLDLELRLTRFEELMDRRPFLLSRYRGSGEGLMTHGCLTVVIALCVFFNP